MALEHKSKWCKRCGEHVLAQRKGTNHILHLILTLLTMGFWIIIWFGCSVKIGGWICTRCGKSL